MIHRSRFATVGITLQARPGAPGSQNLDPPNFVLNFSDTGQIISGFGGFPYKGYDPADCPDSSTWP